MYAIQTEATEHTIECGLSLHKISKYPKKIHKSRFKKRSTPLRKLEGNTTQCYQVLFLDGGFVGDFYFVFLKYYFSCIKC